MSLPGGAQMLKSQGIEGGSKKGGKQSKRVQNSKLTEEENY
jgi:hypothetical protein